MAIYEKHGEDLKRVAIGKVQHDTTLTGDGTADDRLGVNQTDVVAGPGIDITENIESNQVSIGIDLSEMEPDELYAIDNTGKWTAIPEAESTDLDVGTGLSIDDSEDDKIIIEIDETDMEDGKTYGYQPTEGWTEIQESPDLDVGTGLSIDDSEDDKITIE
ncbi:MAG: hypothetical protein MJZ25_03520, partial [Fibrobacter sp.]|nr:hypothetical protein [Fibrobacter sp.]